MTTVTMPQLGESVTEGTILAWMKQPGDPVALDDSLCEIETEKVTAELPSPYEGVMGEILVPQGETVDVGVALCTVLESAEGAPTPNANGDQTPAAKASGWSGGPMSIPPDETDTEDVPIVAPAEAPATAPARQPAVAAAARPSTRPDQRERFYSPAVMRLAQEHSVDLSALQGSGIGGRVTRKDVEAAIQHSVNAPAAVAAPQAPAAATLIAEPGTAYTVVPLTPTRRTIAENLKRSNLEAPQAWTMVEADVTGLVRLRARERAAFVRQEGVELTLLPYFTLAVCETLREFPMMNARWEGEELRHYRALDIGIAVASEHGLVVPVIHGAGDLSVAGLARRIVDIAQRAQTRKLRLEDIEGGTFTVNNTGSFGSIASKPIVNYPQVGIVTMERVVKRAVVRDDDAIAIRSVVNVCLSFDHRALDGVEAGGFLAALKRRLEAIA
ncbi:MAG: dihydrolipoamide acetyltransferase family protein [Anaerolineaceae bacterium]